MIACQPNQDQSPEPTKGLEIDKYHSDATPYDVVVFGGTPSGVIAAVSAAKRGHSVLLIEPSATIGGMVSGGLSVTDIGEPSVVGGLTGYFYNVLVPQLTKDERPDCFKGQPCLKKYAVAPHIGLKAFQTMLQNAGVAISLKTNLLAVSKDRNSIRSIQIQSSGKNPTVVDAKVFIDSSYEGDLMAMAKVSYAWGREGRQTYNEPDAGIQAPRKIGPASFNPFIDGDPGKGYLSFQFSIPPSDPAALVGKADQGVMAYNYRICVTNDPKLFLEGEHFPTYPGLAFDPRDFDAFVQRHYGLVKEAATPKIARLKSEWMTKNYPHGSTAEAEARWKKESKEQVDPIVREAMLDFMTRGFNPGETPYFKTGIVTGVDAGGEKTSVNLGKFDLNGGGILGTDIVKLPQQYPDGTADTRIHVANRIRLMSQNLLYLLAHFPNPTDPSLIDLGANGDVISQYMKGWSLCNDEFQQNGNWPTQLYVREGRRMLGRYVMTEHNVLGTMVPPDPIGLGSYNMDSHVVSLYSKDGSLYIEGDEPVDYDVHTPYAISYGSLTPKETEAANLLVSVTVSASRMAIRSLRMEPQYMIMGQAAGEAAALAVERSTSVQAVNYDSLANRLTSGDYPQKLGPKTNWGIEEFLTMKVCLDESGNIIPGMLPTDSACVKSRSLQTGDALPYHLANYLDAADHSSLDYQCVKLANGSYGVALKTIDGSTASRRGVGIYDNFPLAHRGKLRYPSLTSQNYPICNPVTGLALKDQKTVPGSVAPFGTIPTYIDMIGTGDGYASIMANWHRDSDGRSVVAGSSTPSCRTNRHSSKSFLNNWALAPLTLIASGEDGTGVFRGKALDRLPRLSIGLTDDDCPTDLNSYRATLNMWSRAPFAYGSSKIERFKLDTILSHPYSQVNVTGDSYGDGQQSERMYWTKEFGMTRYEMWKRDDQIKIVTNPDGSITKVTAIQRAIDVYASGVCSKPAELPSNPTKALRISLLKLGQDSEGHKYWYHETTDENGMHRWYLAACQDRSNIIRLKNLERMPTYDDFNGPEDDNWIGDLWIEE